MADRKVRVIPLANNKWVGAVIIFQQDPNHTKVTLILRVLWPEISIGFALWHLHSL